MDAASTKTKKQGPQSSSKTARTGSIPRTLFGITVLGFLAAIGYVIWYYFIKDDDGGDGTTTSMADITTKEAGGGGGGDDNSDLPSWVVPLVSSVGGILVFGVLVFFLIRNANDGGLTLKPLSSLWEWMAQIFRKEKGKSKGNGNGSEGESTELSSRDSIYEV